MLADSTYDTATDLLKWSNRVYVFGAVLTLASAAMVLYEKHSHNQGRALRWGLRTEIVVIVAAFISLCGTVFAINFGNMVGRIKDADLARYQTAADVKIAVANEGANHAKATAATATQNAEKARTEAEQASITASKARLETEKATASRLELQATVEVLHKETLLQQDKLADVETATKPRHLSDSQKKVIVEALTNYSMFHLKDKDRSVHVKLQSSEWEAMSFAEEIEQVLRAAGFEPDLDLIIGSPAQGMAVLVSSYSKQQPPLATAILGAFRGAGVVISPEIDLSIPRQSFAIGIGSKPLSDTP